MKRTSRGYLNGWNLALHEGLQLHRQRGAGAVPGLEHHEGARLLELLLVFVTHHRRLEHRRVLQEAVLDLHRRDVPPAHFQQVVGAAAVPVVAVRVAHELVGGDAPLAAEGLEAHLAAVPVAHRDAAALDPERPDVAVGDLPPLVVHELHFIAGHGLAEAAGHDLAEPVAHEDVEHLGRADAIEQLHPEALVPAAVQLHRQRLARAGGHAQLAPIVGLHVLEVHHRVHGGGDITKRGDLVLRHHLQHPLGRALLGEEHARRANAEGEEQVVA